jgi:Na+-transporting NADH:ubiquinone oxidoreductase subunit B
MRQTIERLFESQRHLFEGKDAKLGWAWPMFEGAETFFLTPGEKTHRGVHVRDAMDMKRLMIFVVYALVPCILAGWYNAGYQGYLAEGITDPGLVDCILRGGVAMLPIIIMSYTAGGAAELVFCVVRKHEINEGFLVTAMLFPLTLPPTIPLWMVAAGIVFGVVIGKEVFGGVGMNFVNPALTARAFVFFTYPAQISGARVWDLGGKDMFAGPVVDGYTGATPLLAVASAERGADPVAVLAENGWTLTDLFLGMTPGSMGEGSTLAVLLGAALLIITGLGSWRTMVSCVVGAVLTATMFNFLPAPEEGALAVMRLPAHYHLAMGGFAFGAVFMATDPVSSAATPLGRIIYGFCIGVLAVTVRVVNPAYPEGMMLAILFMNVFAPLIDYYIVKHSTRRRLARQAA